VAQREKRGQKEGERQLNAEGDNGSKNIWRRERKERERERDERKREREKERERESEKREREKGRAAREGRERQKERKRFEEKQESLKFALKLLVSLVHTPLFAYFSFFYETHKKGFLKM